MKVKVYKTCLEDSHSLYVNDKKRNYVVLDRKDTRYSADRFIFKIFDMISDWPTEMINPEIIDGLEYKIVIKENNQEKSYVFKNKFPEDIFRLENLISEILEELTYEK